MNEKLGQIYDSYINGQKKQMVKQIKAYGQKKFMIDFYNALGYPHTDPKAAYAAVVYTFFLLK